MRRLGIALAKGDGGLQWRTLALDLKMSVRVLVLPVIVKLDLKHIEPCSAPVLSAIKWE